MIQLDTVSSRTDVSDYWDETLFSEETYTVKCMDNVEKSAYVVSDKHTVVEDVLNECDSNRFVVVYGPDTIYDHPDAHVKVSVYDGYNE